MEDGGGLAGPIRLADGGFGREPLSRPQGLVSQASLRTLRIPSPPANRRAIVILRGATRRDVVSNPARAPHGRHCHAVTSSQRHRANY
jgi:hypothetical protein